MYTRCVLSFCVFLSISMKELKALLPLLNYKAPSSRALKDKILVLFFYSCHILITLVFNKLTFFTFCLVHLFLSGL